ncbi:MAG: GTP-binding protein [Lentisphaeria bacterium]|nr:GTP-binding protein [Lentisphaeria bacterium]
MKKKKIQKPIRRVPVCILNGFLGSGKTTLLRNLLAQSYEQGLSLGVIVNDMSELDVDGALIGDVDIFEKENYHFETIYSCVLSSKRGITQLKTSLNNILKQHVPDLIIIETSGSCHPMPLIDFFKTQSRFMLTGVLTLVDSAMVDQDYEGGQKIVPTMEENVRNNQRGTTNLLVEQAMFCNQLLLTKADRVEESKINQIAHAIHDLNPFVSVMSVPWGRFKIDQILAMPEYNYHRVAKLTKELKPTLESEQRNERPYNILTRVIKDDRPFHPERLWETCQKELGQHIYRSKGFFYLPSRDEVALLWNQAAGGISLELVGHWRAGMLENEDHGLAPEEIEGLKEMMAKEKGRFGDRHCHLTVIGDKHQVDRFAKLLEDCLLTEEEVDFWRRGGTFKDPWPQKLVKAKQGS